MAEQLQLSGRLDEIAIRPSDPLYKLFRSSYMRVGSPTIVFRARNEKDVQEVVRFAAEAKAKSNGEFRFSVRSGGHGISGQSTNDGGIILDLSEMRSVAVTDPENGLVQVEPGAVWGEVALKLREQGLVLTSGNFAGTGVGGLAGSGGLGYFVRSQGMTVDHIRAARLVTADGEVHVVDANNEPDLFWAIRGGASQVGVVTEFTFKAVHLEATHIIHQQAQILIDDLPDFVEKWGALMRDAPREFTSFLMLHRGEGERCFATAQNVWGGNDVEGAKPILNAFTELPKLIGQSARIVPYSEIVVGGRHANVGQQDIKMRDGLVDVVDRKAGEALKDAMCHHIAAVGELRSVGGAVNDVNPADTAYAHRHQEGLLALWTYPEAIEEIDKAWQSVQNISTGMYGFYSSDTRPSAAALTWPGQTGERLLRIARQVDPDGLFTYGLSVRSIPQVEPAA